MRWSMVLLVCAGSKYCDDLCPLGRQGTALVVVIAPKTRRILAKRQAACDSERFGCCSI
jgi:hypothetical protein